MLKLDGKQMETIIKNNRYADCVNVFVKFKGVGGRPYKSTVSS